RRSARFRASAKPASSRASRCFSPPTPPTTSPVRPSWWTGDGQSREHRIAVRGAAVAPPLRLLGPAAHELSGAPARRHPGGHGGAQAGQGGDAFSRRGADVPRSETAIGRAGGGAGAARNRE